MMNKQERKKLVNVLRQIKNRCDNPNNGNYSLYGARGIGYDPDLMNAEAILSEIGPRPSPDHSIDRIDNDLGYVRGNLRWATWDEQARNRRSTILLTYDGQTMCATDWGRLKSIPAETIRHRLERGWSHADAIETPVKRRRSRV